MTSRNADSSSQVENGNPPQQPPPGATGPHNNQQSRNGNKVYKSGPLFLSSKGIGWTSWKKRWFILTNTSLVFFRNDPNAAPQKGSEVNLTLGGIDLNSSGSVVVKADKKLLTVLFPDGRDGRAFTLKAETSEDLHEWKAALEEALANAPSGSLVMGQNGILKNDKGEAADGSTEQTSKERQPPKSLVIGRPILLALEDIDGTPSFLEKALRFLEENGVKVEGILRQAADVDDVEHRIREYEQGKTDFSPDEDPHIIADCIKYVLRELPSSPVPASCCNALLEACRTERSIRVSAMRGAICETFPEPNRRLLQRILMMMQTVASHKNVNRMSTSAVAACMAPLLLRPLLAGDCELENVFDLGGDGSVQLLQAAAAANHAQAIVITLLEEYDNIFGEGSITTELYSDSEESGSESEELSEDDETYDEEEDGDDISEGSDGVDDYESTSNVSGSEIAEVAENGLEDNKGSGSVGSNSNSCETVGDLETSQNLSPRSPQPSSIQSEHEVVSRDIEVLSRDIPNQTDIGSTEQVNEPGEQLEVDCSELSSMDKSTGGFQKSTTMSNGPTQSSRQRTTWGRTGAKKNLSMESIEVTFDNEAEVQRLEVVKTDLQKKIAEEAKVNVKLQEDLVARKNYLEERRIALEQDVDRLQEQLRKERDLRMALEAGLRGSQVASSLFSNIDEKTRADLEDVAKVEADVNNLKQKADDLGAQLNQQRDRNSGHSLNFPNQEQKANNQGKVKEKDDVEATATQSNLEKSTRSKDSQISKTLGDKDLKQQPHSSTHKQNPQSDSVRNSRSSGTQAASPNQELGVGKSSTTSSKKTSSKGEGSSSTNSALSKLTNRLNFLKERRNQIANELQNIDRERISVQKPEKGGKGSELSQAPVNINKSQGAEVQSSDKGRIPESYQFQQKADGTSAADPREVQSVNTTEKARRTEGQQTPNTDKLKSDSFPAEKTRSVNTPRTLSR